MKIIKKILLIILIISIIIVCYLTYKNITKIKNQPKINEKIIQELERLIPDEYLEPLGESDEMSTLEIESTSYIGIIDIPSLNLKIPISSSKSSENIFAPVVDDENSNSERMVLISNQDYGRIKELIKLKEYDEIIFKDVRGQKYKYLVSSVTNADEIEDGGNDNLILQLKNLTITVTVRGILEN